MNSKLLQVLINSRHGKKSEEEQDDFMTWLWHGGGLEHYDIDRMPEHAFIDTFNYYWDMPDY